MERRVSIFMKMPCERCLAAGAAFAGIAAQIALAFQLAVFPFLCGGFLKSKLCLHIFTRPFFDDGGVNDIDNGVKTVEPGDGQRFFFNQGENSGSAPLSSSSRAISL